MWLGGQDVGFVWGMVGHTKGQGCRGETLVNGSLLCPATSQLQHVRMHPVSMVCAPTMIYFSGGKTTEAQMS